MNVFMTSPLCFSPLSLKGKLDGQALSLKPQKQPPIRINYINKASIFLESTLYVNLLCVQMKQGSQTMAWEAPIQPACRVCNPYKLRMVFMGCFFF